MSNVTRSVIRIRASALAVMAVTAATTLSARADEGDWSGEVTPYIWAVGIDADVTVRNQTVAIDKSFSDLLEATEIGLDLLAIARYKRVVFWGQIDAFSLDTDELDEAPERGNLETKMLMTTLAVGYQFGVSERSSVDVLLGARLLALENRLELETLGAFEGDRDLVDPVIIVRPSFQISERWRFNPTFSFGSGGDSEKTYELQPQVQFQFTRRIAGRIGYRKLYYEIESDAGNRFDGAFQGLLIGVGGTFGGSQRAASNRSEIRQTTPRMGDETPRMGDETPSSGADSSARVPGL